MKKKTKIGKILSLALIAGAMAIVARSVLALEIQSFPLNGQIRYNAWSGAQADITNLYARTWRHGSWFGQHRINTNYFDRAKWGSLGDTYCALISGKVNINNNDPVDGGCPLVTYTLDQEEYDFANLQFAYQTKVNGNYRLWPADLNVPLATVTICGQPAGVLEALAGRSSFPLTLSLPNPGTCDDEHHQIVIEMIPNQVTTRPVMITLTNFSFSKTHFGGDDQIALAFTDERPLANLTRRYRQIASSGKNAWFDYDRQYHTVGDVTPDVATYDAQGEIAAHNTFDSLMVDVRLAVTNAPQIKAVAVEDDGSVSVLATTGDYRYDSYQYALVAGVASTAETLVDDWSRVEKINSQPIANYYGLDYVSQVNAWQTSNYVLPETVSWTDGFYIGWRMRDSWSAWSQLTDIYYCRESTCAPTGKIAARNGYISEIYFGNEEVAPYVEVTTSVADVDLTSWRLTDGPDEGVVLADAGRTQDQKSVYRVDWPDLVRSHTQLQLYAPDGTLIDQVDLRMNETSQFGWRRDPVTLMWKEVYVNPYLN